MEIDVEKIMEEIRRDIAARGESAEFISFDEIPYESNSVVSEDAFSMAFFDENITFANQRYWIEAYRPLQGNAMAVFVKKVIRKLTKFYVEPIVTDQNNFNVPMLRAMNSVHKYIKETDEQNKSLKELQENLRLMEIKLSFLQKELERKKN